VTKNILNIEAISRIDRENMLGLLIAFPEQCNRAMRIGKEVGIPEKFKRRYRNVVFLGLGGSAIGADIINSYLNDECNIPISVVRDYSIPAFVDEDSLVFATSYSGNTEETISMYKDAESRGAKIITITSGGKLEKSAEENSNLLVKIPDGLPPRCALGYSFIPALVLLFRLRIIKDKTKDIDEAVSLLRKMCKDDVGLSAKKNISKEIASRIHGAFPVIYASAKHMNAITVRWRGQLSENAKTLSSSHVYPEMNHNEIVGWREPSNILKKFVVITIRDKNNHPRVKARMDITNSILKKSGFKVMEVSSKGQSLFSRIMSLVYIGDFASFYLSILNKIDPTPVKRIDYLKKQLSRR